MIAARAAALAVALAACGGPAPVSRVEIPPAPSSEPGADGGLSEPLDEIACKPSKLVALDPGPSGGIDEGRLREALLAARDFAQRCCNGDEAGDATVRVTVSPEGYQTDVAIEPERFATDATGACVRATFRRVVVKSFQGAPRTVAVDVRLR